MMVFMFDPVSEMGVFRLTRSVSLQEDGVGFNSAVGSLLHARLE